MITIGRNVLIVYAKLTFGIQRSRNNRDVGERDLRKMVGIVEFLMGKLHMKYDMSIEAFFLYKQGRKSFC